MSCNPCRRGSNRRKEVRTHLRRRTLSRWSVECWSRRLPAPERRPHRAAGAVGLPRALVDPNPTARLGAVASHGWYRHRPNWRTSCQHLTIVMGLRHRIVMRILSDGKSDLSSRRPALGAAPPGGASETAPAESTIAYCGNGSPPPSAGRSGTGACRICASASDPSRAKSAQSASW